QHRIKKIDSPGKLLDIPDIRNGLIAAAGLSDKAASHLGDDGRTAAIKEFIEKFLSPAGDIKTAISQCENYIALGELKGGIDPAGADEHWKTAKTALDRIKNAFMKNGFSPYLFFVGAAIEHKMAGEIFNNIKSKYINNAANLTKPEHITALSDWLIKKINNIIYRKKPAPPSLAGRFVAGFYC
ncbi:MAG: hypothetical protein LBD48_14490, partial [Treponema sp.]|nr:hypothetical protein [Treponema sp.]